MLANKLLGSNGSEKLYVDDCFSCFLYTGNGSTQTINNGIDLAGKGGMVWIKPRNTSLYHTLYDTSRGALKYLQSVTTETSISSTDTLTGFNSDGFSLGANGGAYAGLTNKSGDTYASWTFRRAKKFFDAVTYTGNGVAGRQIAHELGIAPGMIISKSTSMTGDWNVYHRSATGDLKLNLTNAQTASRTLVTGANDSTFTVSGAANTNGVTYVAYLWAHDPAEDGIIQCGSYTGNGSTAGPVINLGWEPQYVIMKAANNATGWLVVDSLRGLNMQSAYGTLYPNTSNAEAIVPGLTPTATGFQLNMAGEPNQNTVNYIYLAIRRPNKPPKTGTQVYNAIARTGTGVDATVTGVGFAPDFIHAQTRDSYGLNVVIDRLRGGTKALNSYSTSQEDTTSLTFDMGGFSSSYAWFTEPIPSINHFFKRAPGFFDVVCYTGTNMVQNVAHQLRAVPELIITKSRSHGFNWGVYYGDPAKILYLNTSGIPVTSINAWNNTPASLSAFTVYNANETNGALGGQWVAYLFATLPGISKVGSYTGNGSSQTINCGFSTGARFILIKRTDSTGDWYVWDSVRGIVAANDPHLSLNSTAAEVTTDDSVDPASSGFIVNQVAATNINVASATYIYLAIA